MLDFLGGSDVTLTVMFGGENDPLIPDSGSAKYTLRDHTGQAVATDVAITTGAASYKANVTVAADKNAIDSSRIFERRTMSVSFEVAGQPFQTIVVYRLLPVMNYIVQPKDVRAFVGVTESELGDDDLDIFAAYLDVRDDVGETDLTAALTSGLKTELAANTMIKMRAVLAVIPSLKTRIAQSEKNGIMGFARPTITDFDALTRAAQDAYDAAKLAALGDSAIADPTLILVTEDPDVITGA